MSRLQQYLEAVRDFKKLEKNKVALSPEEHDEVMRAKAIWHHGPNGEETAAVWKSKNDDGSFIYVTNTHRAAAYAPTLKGAINKYHKTIKGTA